MELVRARGVRKTVGKGRSARIVLDGVDLEVDSGELIAVFGRSGSGKSTLLNLLGGLDHPDSGTIEVGGDRLDRLTERELNRFRSKRVGFVFQLFHLLDELTAEQNITMPTRIAGNGTAVRARRLMHRLGISGVADQLPHTLSGGEQQRVAIARALINDAPLILADEPTGNLDSAAAADVLGILRALTGEDRSVLLVTHDPEAAEAADRVLVLEDGRLRS